MQSEESICISTESAHSASHTVTVCPINETAFKQTHGMVIFSPGWNAQVISPSYLENVNSIATARYEKH